MELNEAYNTVSCIVSRAVDAGIPCIYKKTDSALRGNIGSELAAMLQASGERRVHFIPAFPKLKRVTAEGIHYIDGVPVAESVFGQDPFEPVRRSAVDEIIREQCDTQTHLAGKRVSSKLPDGLLIYDAESDQDLETIAAGLRERGEGAIPNQGRDCMTDILMDFILPCNIFLSFQSGADLEMLKSSGMTVLVSVAVMLLVTVTGKLLYGCSPQGVVMRYGLINSNSMFIGLPVIQSLLGAEGVLQLTMYMIFVRIFCWSYGLSLFTGTRSDWKQTARQLALHPCMLAAFIGIAFMLAGIELPVFLTRTLGYVSDCLMAMSMLLVGVVLSEVDWKSLFRGDVWRFAALRLAIVPALVLLLCRLLDASYVITATCTILSGMPAASLTAVLATRYRANAKLVSLIVAVTTILSELTVPAWFLIL